MASTHYVGGLRSSFARRGPGARLGLFAVGLLAVFAVAVGVGSVGDRVAAEPETSPHGHADAASPGSGRDDRGALPVDGTSAVGGGFRLVVAAPDLRPGVAGTLAFAVDADDGSRLTGYELRHERPLHLVLARDDLSAEQHLHPDLGADGTWRVDVTLPSVGRWRAIADFVPAGGTEPVVLGVDLLVPGEPVVAPLPAPAREVAVDGYVVTLDGTARAGEDSMLRFTVRRDGQVVSDLQPYLGAAGHLVVLRAGDLAYLHAHPDGDRLAFSVPFPSAGPHRVHLEFQHGGVVHTAAFTLEVAGVSEPTAAPVAIDLAIRGMTCAVVRGPHRADAEPARRRLGGGELRARDRAGRGPGRHRGRASSSRSSRASATRPGSPPRPGHRPAPRRSRVRPARPATAIRSPSGWRSSACWPSP